MAYRKEGAKIQISRAVTEICGRLTERSQRRLGGLSLDSDDVQVEGQARGRCCHIHVHNGESFDQTGQLLTEELRWIHSSSIGG
jgi:hypothetical protein